MSVGLHHLRYFVAVAEEGHVSRAAEKLQMAQPSLSAQIKYLEKHLGVALFRRHSRGVELTRAGALFLVDARASLESADAAIAVARKAARGQSGKLSIGFLVSCTSAESIARGVTAFRERHPRASLEFAEYTFNEPSAGLRDGSVDLAVLMPPISLDGLSYLELYREPRVVVLGDTHPLATRESVSVRELFDDPWVVADTRDEACRDFWLATRYRDGRPPKLGPPTRTTDKFIQLVGAGEVVGLAEESAQRVFARPGIRFVPVSDVEPAVTALAWRPGTPNSLVDSFLDVAREQLNASESPTHP